MVYNHSMSKRYGMAERSDGLGANIHGYMSVWAYCNHHGIEFIHLPFMSIGLFSDDGNKKVIYYTSSELDDINSFFGLPPLKDRDEFVGRTENLELFPYMREVFDDPNKYLTAGFLTKTRDMYYKNDKSEYKTCNGIVIHIRRNDISETCNSGRFIHNDVYLRIINSLRKEYPTSEIHIMSDGKEEDFKGFEDTNSVFHLNEDILSTFHYMVTAKVLVPAISSLSIAAACLNTNVIYVSKDVNSKRMCILNHWKLI